MNNTTECPRILVAEDDDDQRELICEALRTHYNDPQGRRIVSVSSGHECLAQDLNSFDIILQDYHIGDMSGLELLDQILARADLPVVFVTAENVAATAAEAIQHGAEDYVLKLGDYLFSIPVIIDKSIRQHRMKKENERLQKELESMLNELQLKNIQLRESLDKLKTMATTDPLTGLANRRRFGEILEQYYGEAFRYGFDLSCCMCDLDDYKQLNDTLGHQVGDKILEITAEVIRSSLRKTDIAARYGGDEFVLLFPHTSMDRAIEVGERIRQQLAERSGKDIKLNHTVTMCIGVASLEADRPTTADALVSMADRALYAAKDHGKDQIITFGSIREAVEVRG